jgi:hypothetical protein
MTITANTGTSITVSIATTFVSGNVCVSATNACGAGTSRCLAVTAKPATPAAITGSASVCKSRASAVAYSIAAVTNATGYTWAISGGATISGTSTTGTANFTTATATTASVTVTANNACGSSTAQRLNVSVNLSCRDAGNGLTNMEVNAFPNPTNGRLTVKLNAPEASTYTLRLIDLLGKQIYAEYLPVSAGENIKELDLSDMAKGVYMLNIQSTSKDSQTLRIILE